MRRRQGGGEEARSGGGEERLKPSVSSCLVTCSGAKARGLSHALDSSVMAGLPSSPSSTLYEKWAMSDCTPESLKERPIRRFASLTVLVGLAAAWFLAPWPTRRVPSCAEKATHDGVVREPSSFWITSTRPAPAIVHATHE